MTIKALLDHLELTSIIAVLAFFVALWQVISSRKHNKLSVQPYLDETLSSDSVNLICKFEIKENNSIGLIREKLCKIRCLSTNYTKIF
jgi:hypothetical protein